jgi:hypothetical protein
LPQVFTLGAGVQWQEAYAAADSQNQLLVGGFSAGGNVGSAGGWVSGGGHSALSPQYGLGELASRWPKIEFKHFVGVDNVVQMTVVTADGSHLIANEFVNLDLSWALRGGGGGTYGVLTSVSYKSHPSTPFMGAFFNASRTDTTSTDPDAIQKTLTKLVAMIPDLVSKGYGGYGGADNSSIHFFLGSPTATHAQANETYQPFFDYALSLAQAGGLSVLNSTVPHPSFISWYSMILPESEQVRTPDEGTSWLLPKGVMTKEPETAAKKLLTRYLLLMSTIFSSCRENIQQFLAVL